MKLKVKNMRSSKGNSILNQFLIYTDKGIIFQSYDSIIAFKRNDGKIVLSANWDYSKTTSKYRNIFLGESKKETQAKINSGEYAIDNNL